MSPFPHIRALLFVNPKKELDGFKSKLNPPAATTRHDLEKICDSTT